MSFTARIGGLMLAAGVIACRHEVKVELRPLDGHVYTREDERVIQAIADATIPEVRALLPALPRDLILRVQPSEDVIPETGETASTRQPGFIYWSFDPMRPGGAAAIATRELRRTLFHELHHLVRDAAIERTTLVDTAVAEGLATAFERDHAGAPAPWGRYPDDVAAWAQELRALPADTPREHWLRRHPDGRRWIAYKVGTYWADRATRASGRTVADLVATPSEEILELAE